MIEIYKVFCQDKFNDLEKKSKIKEFKIPRRI